MKSSVTTISATEVLSSPPTELSFLQTFESGILNGAQPQGKIRSHKFKEDVLEGIVIHVTEEEVAGLDSILDKIISAAVEFLRSGRPFRKQDIIETLGLLAVEASLSDLGLHQVTYRAAVTTRTPNFDIIRSERGKVSLIEFVKLSDGLRNVAHHEHPVKVKPKVRQLL